MVDDLDQILMRARFHQFLDSFRFLFDLCMLRRSKLVDNLSSKYLSVRFPFNLES
jgi:hypothetical protein